MSSKPILLYTDFHDRTPNPKKVEIILHELNINFEKKILEEGGHKKEPYLEINPNGRVPAIEDPNTGYKLWESGAIIEYLVDKYDKDGKLSYKDGLNSYLCKQFLYFQVSGQGPYFGQKAWFSNYHNERLPSAEKRYADEIKRVVSVLDLQLKRNGTGWLVGDKCTYADLSFIPWNRGIPRLLSSEEARAVAEENPHFTKWHEALVSRPKVEQALN